MGDGTGDYVRLGGCSADPEAVNLGLDEARCPLRKCSLWCWLKVVISSIVLLAVVAVFVIWGGPFLLKKVVTPILDWEMAAVSRPVLGLILFASIALFPALLLPSSPCMWIAGITFGYGFGFLLIMAGISVGMSLPYFIGSLFRYRIHKWLERWPKKAAIIRLAGEGNWFHQFRAVTLIRISPFPYIIFNYAAVATNVKYSPYIVGSLVGTIPETFLTIYSGILIRTLADATNQGGFLSMEQVIYDALGFCVAVVATIAITIYAKKALRTLQVEEELG
ncbi:hypothetical protein J5N97_029228 [Dioscorea zingiberensis]|uniref:VTT domain-containing protein n=1 Tax=Dioscorea zingiberensis TaxID=325984 RepID=A0A9D5C0E2_9LILI|nr:hypothetical protein J5N97_029228 [Dioscorea zingiberensis]